MDLNLTLIGATYLVPVALTLRKVYAPSFDIPEAMALVVARIDRAPAPAVRQRVRELV